MNNRHRDILSLALVVLLIVGIIITLHLINTGVNPFSKANVAYEPKQIVVGNLWNSRFSIAFETSATDASATLLLGEKADDISKVFYDANGSDYKGNLHFFNVTGLKSNSVYYFHFLINGTVYDNGGKPYELTTLNLDTTPFENLPITGKIEPVTSPCIVYSHLYNETANSLASMDYIATNGSYTLNTDYYLNPSNLTAFDRENSKLLTFVRCFDANRGGIESTLSDSQIVIKVSTDYPIEYYDNSAKGLLPTASTIVPTTSVIVPTTSTASIPITTISTQTTRPQISSSLAPTKVIPKTAIGDDIRPLLLGLFLLVSGLYLRNQLQFINSQK
mgnify:CR=1 FL=1